MTLDRRNFIRGTGALLAAGGIAAGGIAGAARASENDIIGLKSGQLRGRTSGDIRIFTGIPFGDSTGGAARFRAPRPAPSWSGVLDAAQPARICPQDTNELFPQLPGLPSEDCLQLNIWAPNAPGPHPVLVWIHGGGNTIGSAGEPIFDGAIFARDGIVTVNINYRLGAFGFLELGGILGAEYRGSANNSLLDQLLALRWVKENVAAFGGDPNRVTVAGESAGGFNLATLLGMPGHSGLFKRAIVASGGQAVVDAATADALAKVFVEQLGGTSQLSAATPDAILAAQRKTLQVWKRFGPFRALIGVPSLPVAPLTAIREGSARSVDLMIGWCRDESRMLIPPAVAADPAFVPPTMWAQPAQMEQIIKRYAQRFPQAPRANIIWKASTAEYFGTTSLRIADAQAAAGARVLRYRLDYTVVNGPYGDLTGHGFDVPMVFDRMDSRLAQLYGYSSAEKPMQQTMHQVWSSFIRTGEVQAGIPEWPAFEPNKKRVMILDRRSHVVDDPESVDREIWADTV